MAQDKTNRSTDKSKEDMKYIGESGCFSEFLTFLRLPNSLSTPAMGTNPLTAGQIPL